MTTLQTAAQQALEALEAMNPYPASKEDQRASALAALRAALAQQDEPVWMHPWPPVRAQQSEPVDCDGCAEVCRRAVVCALCAGELTRLAQHAEPVEPVAWTDRERRVVRFALKCFISQALDRHAAAAQDVRGMWFKPGDHHKFYQDAADATSALTKMGAAEPLGVSGEGHSAAPSLDNHSPRG